MTKLTRAQRRFGDVPFCRGRKSIKGPSHSEVEKAMNDYLSKGGEIEVLADMEYDPRNMVMQEEWRIMKKTVRRYENQ